MKVFPKYFEIWHFFLVPLRSTYHLISLSKFNLPLIGTFTWPTPPGPYRAMTCRGRELNYGSHTYFFDLTRTWRASPDEGWAQCWGHLRDSTNMKDNTHQAHTQSSQQGEYGMIITTAKWYSGTLGGLKFPDMCLTGEEKPQKTSPRKPVPTGDRTRARCVTSTHATTCSTAVDLHILKCKYSLSLYSLTYSLKHEVSYNSAL